MNEISIASKKIGRSQKPFIIAEMSGNHDQSLEKALKIIDQASECGADAIKLQTYTADDLTLDIHEKEFVISDKKSLWYGESLYKLYKRAYTPWEWHSTLFSHAKKKGIICFSSPFSRSAVDKLEDLNAPAYKIASFENCHTKLIEKVASTGKPIIISIGMASIEELNRAVTIVRENGNKNLILLKCTSTYPASPKNSNILTIPHLRDLFKCEVGLSDHTKGIGTAIGSIAHGATIIEKHFTLSRESGGVDADFSLEPSEMKLLVDESKHCWESLGEVFYGPTEAEKNSIGLRRSIYISRDMDKGEIFSEKNLRIIRPGKGLEPLYFDLAVGKKLKKSVKKGTPLSWELIL